MVSRFVRAPFPLYGLPPTWKGVRHLGPARWSRSLGGGNIESLSLVHKTLREEGPILVVETALPNEDNGGGLLRVVANEVWKGRANSVVEALDILRSQWRGLRDSDLAILPTRIEAVLRVEGRPETFDVLSQPRHWVGRAGVGGYQLTIEGHDIPLEGLMLVEITDLQPYINGSRRSESDMSSS
jgi:hypothetical protein